MPSHILHFTVVVASDGKKLQRNDDKNIKLRTVQGIYLFFPLDEKFQ